MKNDTDFSKKNFLKMKMLEIGRKTKKDIFAFSENAHQGLKRKRHRVLF